MPSLQLYQSKTWYNPLEASFRRFYERTKVIFRP